MTKQHALLMIAAALTLSACGSKEDAEKAAKDAPTPSDLIANQPIFHGPEIKNVELKTPLDPAWVVGGKAQYDTKCMPCHKLDGTKLVGPGWKDVTKRRQPIWIMNMICNTDYMLSQDAEAQKQLELCLVRMPNQNVAVDDARKILEFMRSNDGEK
jgi:cytochrome c5